MHSQQYLSPEHAKAMAGNNSQGPVYKIYVSNTACVASRHCMLPTAHTHSTVHHSSRRPAPHLCAHLCLNSHVCTVLCAGVCTCVLCDLSAAVLCWPPARLHSAQPRQHDIRYSTAAAQARQGWRARPWPLPRAPCTGRAEGEQARHTAPRCVWHLHTR